jgi:hypothetical protein
MAHLWEYDKKYTQEAFADIVAKFGPANALEMLANVCYERADEAREKDVEKSWDFIGQKLDSLSLRAKDGALKQFCVKG